MAAASAAHGVTTAPAAASHPDAAVAVTLHPPTMASWLLNSTYEEYAVKLLLQQGVATDATRAVVAAGLTAADAALGLRLHRTLEALVCGRIELDVTPVHAAADADARALSVVAQFTDATAPARAPVPDIVTAPATTAKDETAPAAAQTQAQAQAHQRGVALLSRPFGPLHPTHTPPSDWNVPVPDPEPTDNPDANVGSPTRRAAAAASAAAAAAAAAAARARYIASATMLRHASAACAATLALGQRRGGGGAMACRYCVRGDTPLHLAVRAANVPVCRALLALAPALDLHALNAQGQSPKHVLAQLVAFASSPATATATAVAGASAATTATATAVRDDDPVLRTLQAVGASLRHNSSDLKALRLEFQRALHADAQYRTAVSVLLASALGVGYDEWPGRSQSPPREGDDGAAAGDDGRVHVVAAPPRARAAVLLPELRAVIESYLAPPPDP